MKCVGREKRQEISLSVWEPYTSLKVFKCKGILFFYLNKNLQDTRKEIRMQVMNKGKYVHV